MLDRQFSLNTISVGLNLIVQFSISFFLTSYLVKNVGSTAYGFFNLANTTVNYALILSTALNSMAARFIGIEYHQKNFKKALGYYSSVFYGDLVFVSLLLIPSIILILDVNLFFEVPLDILNDVKVLFFLAFANMCINLCGAVFSSVYVIRNRLDISSYVSVLSNFLKAALLILLYTFFTPSIVYLGIAVVLTSIFVVCSNYYYSRKFLVELSISFKFAEWKLIKVIVIAGVWNSFSQLSVYLLHGLDLLFSNLFVSAVAMGYLSIAGTIPSAISSAIYAMSNVFTPNLLKYYSENRFDKIEKEIKNSIRFMTVISSFPLCILVGFGLPFYNLWVPDTDVRLVYFLSVFVMMPNFTGAAINSTNFLYTITNKVKWPSIVLFINGLINVLCVYILLKFTTIGVISIVMVSAILGILRNIVFNAPYAAKIIKLPFYAFWPDLFKSFVLLCSGSLICFFVSNIVNISSWFELLLIGGGVGIFVSVLIALISLTKSQIFFIINKFRNI